MPTDLARCSLLGGRAASSPSAGGEESPGKPVPTPQMGKAIFKSSTTVSLLAFFGRTRRDDAVDCALGEDLLVSK